MRRADNELLARALLVYFARVAENTHGLDTNDLIIYRGLALYDANAKSDDSRAMYVPAIGSLRITGLPARPASRLFLLPSGLDGEAAQPGVNGGVGVLAVLSVAEWEVAQCTRAGRLDASSTTRMRRALLADEMSPGFLEAFFDTPEGRAYRDSLSDGGAAPSARPWWEALLAAAAFAAVIVVGSLIFL